MSNQVNENVLQEATKRAQALPESTQFAITVALPNILNGAFWGFTSEAEVRKYSEALKGDKNITLRLIKDCVIVEVLPDYMLKAMSSIDPSVVTQKEVDGIHEGISKACAVFSKFLSKNASGFNGFIGIYCINDVPSIVLRGKSHPAFRLPLTRVIAYLAQYDYSIVTPVGIIPAKSVNDSNISEVWKSLVPSPTSTGCFLQIKK